MSGAVPVVDLFSGPGGLAEGFAGCRDEEGRARFEVALSVEKEPSAHRTLRLRAFLRKFGEKFPPEYYDFLNRGGADEPDWGELYPEQWRLADNETLRLELGTREANDRVDEKIDEIRGRHGGRTVLLGGPPCQSYSLVGRARNVGNASYDPSKDKRHSLYREYARVLGRFRPAVAVMENVKGMLSARDGNGRVINGVTDSLRNAAGTDSYRLVAVAAGAEAGFWHEPRKPADFLVRANEYGVPQARHRVIIVCVRRDIAKEVPDVGGILRLKKSDRGMSVRDVIGDMPRLRSRLSRDDSPDNWRKAVVKACRRILDLPMPALERDQIVRFRCAVRAAKEAVMRLIHRDRDVPPAPFPLRPTPHPVPEWSLQDP